MLLAKQWVATIGHALADARAMGPSQLLEFRYEDLVRGPREVMRRIVDFVELPDADDLVEAAARTADASCIDKWRQGLSAETLEEVRPHVEPMLDQLGYEW